MPNEKIKSENYTNFGGINSKYSPYLTSPMEFLDLNNLDFQTPGSLTHRWGSTQYVGQTFAGPIHSLYEYNKLSGDSFVIISHTGGIWSGATTGLSEGMSFTVQGVSLRLTNAVPWFSPLFTGQTVWPYVSGNPRGVFYNGITGGPKWGRTASGAVGQSFYIQPQTQSDNTLSFATFQNYLFGADGNKFFKFDGITTTQVSLPPVLATVNCNNDTSSVFTSDSFGFVVGSSYGAYYFAAAYVNNRGFEGPAFPIAGLVANFKVPGTTPVIIGNSLVGFSISILTPLQYGISSINIYSYYDHNYASQTFASTGQYEYLESALWLAGPRVFFQNVPASGSTFTIVTFGTSLGGLTNILLNQNTLEPTINDNYLPLGFTFPVVGATFSQLYGIITQYYPRYLDVFQNRLFSAGYSTSPSTVWFSQLAEPEGYDPDFNFEVRTNDGDVITGIRAYSTEFYIFKQKSFHILTGDNPNNFFLREVSAQYGCLNNRCIVIYDDILLFLDQKGVILWDGASLKVLSNKVQPIFDSMNFSAALTEACMVHDKLRNQILISIPINGSSTNNITVVYDYLAPPEGAWTKYSGFSASALAQIQGRNNTKNAFYGDYQGRVNWFGSSFLSDNGVGYTCSLKTRFLHDLGESTEKMFRRLFLNTDSPASSTFVFGINFLKNYGDSIVLGTTIVLSQFQNRIDYGVSGKSLAFELATIQSSIPLRVHGFTIESRFLRAV